ncbi:hypothetical protein [Viridibacterium curvum]|uniref:DUF4124 domain-containing protein n=1 Tax=Viridibacterium curvum TaxID=1101404 RepID=A0ABP9QQH1_9RHOO
MPKHWWSLAVLALFAGSALAQGTTPARTTYCCADNNGRKICGDTLPQVCYDRAYTELSGSGRTMREIAAPMTAEQRAKYDAELKAARERAIREAEAKRRDRVLLDSYARVEEIDARRDREIASVEADLKRARAQETELLAKRAALEKLKPATGQIPRDVAEDLVTNSGELAATRSVIDSKQRDIEAIRTRFEMDRTRFIELSGARGKH